MDEIFEITEYVQEEAGNETDLIWGNCYDESLGDKICVTIIATGFEEGRKQPKRENHRTKVSIPTNENTFDRYEPKVVSELILEDAPAETENTVTFEFDDVRPTSEQPPVGNSSFDEPYIRKYSSDAPKPFSQNNYENKQPANPNPVKLNNPNTLVDLENEPAYMRRKINLENVPHSSENTTSKWTLTEDEEPMLKENNSFLYDNVDYVTVLSYLSLTL